MHVFPLSVPDAVSVSSIHQCIDAFRNLCCDLLISQVRKDENQYYWLDSFKQAAP